MYKQFACLFFLLPLLPPKPSQLRERGLSSAIKQGTTLSASCSTFRPSQLRQRELSSAIKQGNDACLLRHFQTSITHKIMPKVVAIFLQMSATLHTYVHTHVRHVQRSFQEGGGGNAVAEYLPPLSHRPERGRWVGVGG